MLYCVVYVFQCVAVCCGVVQCGAVGCDGLQYVVGCCSVMHHVPFSAPCSRDDTLCCGMVQCVVVCCKRVAVCYSVV